MSTVIALNIPEQIQMSQEGDVGNGSNPDGPEFDTANINNQRTEQQITPEQGNEENQEIQENTQGHSEYKVSPGLQKQEMPYSNKSKKNESEQSSMEHSSPEQYNPETKSHSQITPESDGKTQDYGEIEKDNDDENENAVEEKLDSSSDFMFKKKDVRKPRTQSIQSVLSTASLKSLKQQYISNPPPSQRNGSIISNSDKTSKNFQSFIQAPVLSSISNLRGQDDVEIGQQLPFHDKPKPSSSEESKHSDDKLNDEESYDDHETILQQQKLTINALKKLTLSPMPISSDNSDTKTIDGGGNNANNSNNIGENNGSKDAISSKWATRSPSANFNPTIQVKNSQSYQPAQVDLSTFASLTRQTKPSTIALESSPSTKKEKDFAKSSMSSSTSTSTLNFASSIPKPTTVLNEKQPVRVPAAVVPPMDMNVRRAELTSHLNHNSNQPNNPTQPHIHSQPHHQHLKEKHLQQIKGFRSPMYVPAVLRKTINDGVVSGSDSPRGSPQLEAGSPTEMDRYLNNSHSGTKDSSSSRTSVRSFDSNVSTDSMSTSPVSSTGPYTIYKKKYEHILRSAPTRKHWVKDEAALKCGISTCSKVFNFFERRHHCRKCGGIYCKEHTSHYLYINHLAQFTTGGRGTLSKVCDNCIEEYNEFMRHEFGVLMDHHDAKPHYSASQENEPARLNEIPRAAINKNNYSETRNEQLVGSVPANWSWSSF